MNLYNIVVPVTRPELKFLQATGVRSVDAGNERVRGTAITPPQHLSGENPRPDYLKNLEQQMYSQIS